MPRWLNRTVLAIGFASLFSDLSHETVTALLPALLASLGAAAAALGTIEGVADGLSSAAKLYGGWLADRLRSRRRLAAGGYAAMAVAPLVIGVAGHWLVVLAGRVIAWVSRGLRTPARKALLADAVAPEAYGRAFGFERAMDTAGAIIAPAAIYVLLAAGVERRWLILGSAVPALGAVVAVLLARERPGRHPVETPFRHSVRGLGSPFRRFLAAVGLFGLGDFADSFYILYAISVLAPVEGAARAGSLSIALYALHNVLYAAWSYLGGWLADRTNKRLLLCGGYLSAAAAAVCLLAGVDGLGGLAVMFALAGSGVGIYEAVEDAIAAELLPSDLRGTGFGVLALVTGLGDLVSSLAFGWLWASVGLAAASASVLLPMALGAALVFRLALRRGALVS